MLNFLDDTIDFKEKSDFIALNETSKEEQIEAIKEENIKSSNNILYSGKSINDIKVDKNYLFSKEATKLIIDNYEDLKIKSDFLNYLMENLTEYYLLGDYAYIDSFLFPDSSSSITNDIIKKVLNKKDSILFKYYLGKLFNNEETFDFIKGLTFVCKINTDIEPDALKVFYKEKLNFYLEQLTIVQIETYYNKIKKEFVFFKANLFIKDFYNNFMIPIIKIKLKEIPINSMRDLKEACDFISNYNELKYDKPSRVLNTAYELLNTNDNYYSYDADILYDIQEVVEKVLIAEKKLDYNLVYFCSYFDKKIYFRKSLNLIINILEGVNTIAISKTKYDMIEDKTIEESLFFLEWILYNHNRDTKTIEFRKAIKDFINYNWSSFTANNKSFIKLKATLRDYNELEKIIEELKKENTKGFNSFYKNHGPFVFATLISVIFFSVICYFGISFLSNTINTINEQWKLVTIIMIEVITTGIFVLLMTKDRQPEK